ncbi:DNA replication and repair protein RecF [Ereboglobus sp. PH5-10]|uniref:DNA replication/repair protein RecF n=1 Tax=Ereboglobus sp. PH5-10 TaxID=2940629 RepID=UPI0024062061|nr:DNA replication/repair protein RecF [Ereboglobus sp. PH5-10]MDF9826871.1 DNA replication and repair protein RecF [Ereboglobus sp. PH5-10]
MHLKSITVQNFRNIAFAELAFDNSRQFFVGENAQGKTNLLEAAGFISALRSFRTSEDRTLIAHGKPEAAIACEIEHEKFGLTRVTIRLRPGGKEVHCDGERIRKLGDYIGRFPTVVFTSQDLLLVRGSPGGRRRWLDLALAETDPEYLRALQEYHRALASRNQLLKRGNGGASALSAELDAFEQPLARAAAQLAKRRAAGVEKLNTHVAAAYEKITAVAEGRAKPPAEPDRIDNQSMPAAQPEASPYPAAAIAYAPSVANGTALDETGWASQFASGRERDTLMRATLSGPHRDDCELTVGGRPAREFASEGQQRGLAISLRLAEAAYLREQTGVNPVLLADDVLGELDPQRRRRFWAGINSDDSRNQILATGTAPPDAELGAWQMFEVRGGMFS